jgi:G3E family GTPase
VIVNDRAELNSDATLVQQGSTVSRVVYHHPASSTTTTEASTTSTIIQTERDVISLQNGYICFMLRGDLIREIARIRKSNNFDYVLIESTGIAEPQEVAEVFFSLTLV